jgi:hypothetical protein
VTVGQKSLAEGSVEIKLRSESEIGKVSVADATVKVIELVNKLKEQLKL